MISVMGTGKHQFIKRGTVARIIKLADYKQCRLVIGMATGMRGFGSHDR